MIEYVQSLVDRGDAGARHPANGGCTSSAIVPAWNLGRMLHEGDRSDITFEVQGESIPAHIAIVASQSAVFKAELNGLVKERDEYRTTISDMQPDVFKALLCFVYTDALPNMDGLSKDDRLEMSWHLLVAATQYAMDILKLVCAHALV